MEIIGLDGAIIQWDGWMDGWIKDGWMEIIGMDGDMEIIGWGHGDHWMGTWRSLGMSSRIRQVIGKLCAANKLLTTAIRVAAPPTAIGVRDPNPGIRVAAFGGAATRIPGAGFGLGGAWEKMGGGGGRRMGASWR